MALPRIFKFRALEDFMWIIERPIADETGIARKVERKGVYSTGGIYNCTDQQRHDALRVKCEKWEKEGKIEIIPLTNEKLVTIEFGE